MSEFEVWCLFVMALLVVFAEWEKRKYERDE